MITLGKKKKLEMRVGNPRLGVLCPCGCRRGLPMQNIPYTHEMQEFGKVIWQQLVSEKGVEGAIAFFHEAVDEDS